MLCFPEPGGANLHTLPEQQPKNQRDEIKFCHINNVTNQFANQLWSSSFYIESLHEVILMLHRWKQRKRPFFPPACAHSRWSPPSQWPDLCGLHKHSFGFSCKHVLPNASGVGTSLCLLMAQKVPGPACEERRAPGRVLICWATHRDAFSSSFPSSSIPPSFIWAPAQRGLVPCQRLIINFHQHRESKMDSLASCVVTLGMSVNGPAQEETDCVCVSVCVSEAQ